MLQTIKKLEQKKYEVQKCIQNLDRYLLVAKKKRKRKKKKVKHETKTKVKNKMIEKL